MIIEKNLFLSYDGELRPYDPQPGNLLEPWETGRLEKHSVSLSGGSDKGSFRVSMADQKATAIQPNSGYDKMNISINSALNVTDDITAQFVVNYIKEDLLNPLSTGDDDNAFGKALLYNWARSEKVGVRLDNYKNEDGTRGFRGGRGGDLLWRMLEQFRERESDRYIGSLTLNWNVNDWLSVMLRTGVDNKVQQRTFKSNPWDIDRLRGEYNTGLYKDNINSNDLLITINKDINEDLNVTSNIGLSDFKDKRYSLASRNYNGFSNPDLFAIDNNDGDRNNPNEGFYHKETRSVLGTLNFNYKNYLFLEATGRNDWSSTLPKGANSYFYPSVSSSFVFSDVLGDKLPSWLSNGKIRASWTKASVDDNPYRLQPTFGIGTWYSIPRAEIPSTIPPVNLRPQKTYAFETGLDLGLFNDKVYLSFNYYTKTSRDQILSGAIPWSSGSSALQFNTGSITNSGVELTVNAFPVVTEDFKWEIVFNYSKNNNKVNNLDDAGGVEELRLGGMWGGNGPSIIAKKGEPYGTIMGWDYIYDNASGKKLVDSDGYPYTTQNRVALGNITPDWLGGLINTFRYKDFSLNVIVDAKIGGDMWFGSKGTSDGFGQSIESMFGRDAENGGLNWTDGSGNVRDDGTIIDAVVSASAPTLNEDGETYSFTTSGENTSIIPARHYHVVQSSGWGAGAPTTGSIYENSFVRLTELQLSYNVPKKFISDLNIQNLSLSIFARNLAYLYKTAPDNINPLGDISPGKIGGREFGSSPITRTLGFSAKVSF